jgi:hypothetical protein
VSAAADGTAALPGIAFASDTNTGIYRPGADQLAISTGGTGRLFVNAAGTIQTAAAGQIETVSSTGTLTLYGGSTNKGGGIRLAGGNIDADIRFYAQQFTATPQERARIDVSGRLLVGTSSARTKYANIFQTETVSGQSNYGFTTVFNADTSNGASIALGKSRGTTAGSNAIVGANDNLGSVQFVGADGTDLESAASIDAFVDSTPAYAATALVNGQTYRIVTVGSTDFTLIGASANTVGTIFTATGPGTGTGTAILNAGNMPGRLVFSTTADGASTPTERMRITSDGYARLSANSGGIQFNGDTAAANALDDYEEGTFTPTLLSDGGVSITLDVTAEGYYRKIGSIVHMWGTIKTTTNLNSANYYQLGTAFTSTLASATHVGTASSSTNAGNANQKSVFSVTSRVSGGLYFVRVSPDYDFSNEDGFSFFISTPV